MTTLTISIIVVFVLGYALIATESLTKVNKAAIALLMLVGCWTLYMVDPMQYLQLMHPDYAGGAAGMVEKVTGIIQEHLGDTATTLFFLMGAMTIVEVVDQNGGFDWVKGVMNTRSNQLALEMILEDESRENHGDKAGEEDLADHASGSDKTLVPQHDGRHVANRRERATGVGGNDDQRGVDDTVVLVGDGLAEELLRA